MAMNIETIENGASQTEPTNNDDSKISGVARRWLITISCINNVIGNVGTPMLLRLYFLHGGTGNWLASWLQFVGFPIFLIPLTFMYFRQGSPGFKFLAPTKLFTWSFGIGIITALTGFVYSYGSSYLPVSTSQLLLSTQLAFTSFFAFFIVKQKFTAYLINAIVVLTMGPILLGLRKNSDRPDGETHGQYLLGFILTLVASLLYGLSLACTEFSYTRIKKPINGSGVLQFLFGVNLTATIFCTIGMLVHKDFQAISSEAREFDIGATKYYVVLVTTALASQMWVLGTFGLVYSTSSIFVGILGTTLLPVSEIMAAILFHEKFTGEKGMALALSLWGFTSYFYGSYKENKKQKLIPLEVNQN